jgi:hypothetical protein
MPTPTPEQQLLAALDSALAATVDFGIRVLKAPRWQPAPDSEASRELASLPSRQDGNPWDDDTARWTYAAASVLMTGVGITAVASVVTIASASTTVALMLGLSCASTTACSSCPGTGPTCSTA